ncbi:MAG: hypothetical protein IPK20_20540 [Betaproteobacteria bacterium]|nr:hypothetical protein [Betaproteobacteria bacterium]
MLSVDVTSGGMRVAVQFSSPLAASTAILRLAVSVPPGADYGKATVLDLADVRFRREGAGGEIVTGDAVADDAVAVTAFFMDTSGNGGYSMLDVQRLQRVVTGLDSGFGAYPNVDPVIVGDLNANGQLTSLDVNRFLQFVQGQVRPEIPSLPAGYLPADPEGADRSLQLGDATGERGDVVLVPIVIDETDGLESFTATLVFDTTRLDYRGTTLTGDYPYRLLRQKGGVITLDVARLNPLTDGAGALAHLEFRIRDDAPAGNAFVDLQRALVNDGGFDLASVPGAGTDPTDGIVTVEVPLPPAPLPTTPMPAVVPLVASGGAGGASVDWTAAWTATTAGIPPAVAVPPAASASDQWKNSAWARDLTQRLQQMPAEKSVLKSLLRVLGKSL